MTVLNPPRPAGISLPVGRWLVLLVAALLFAIGWSVAKTKLTVVWCAVALRVGWDEAHRRREGAT